MITINGKEYRNLEEQVQKNKEDIANHYNIDRVLADFGIKVIGQLDSADDLPESGDSYGDAYAIGTEAPYNFYIWTRANEEAGQPNDYWFNIGALAIVGPQGPQGPKGATGDRGPKGDRGERGPAGANGTNGATGPQGPKGDTGATGPQGVQGPTGTAVHIVDTILSSSGLPSPTSLNDLTAAYLVGTADHYDLYIQVGLTPATALWNNMGEFNPLSVGYWEFSNGKLIPVEAITDIEINNLNVLNTLKKNGVDVATTGDVQQATARQLNTPSVAPTNPILVGIGTNNAQTNYQVGTGLKIENGALKSDIHLYRHNVVMEFPVDNDDELGNLNNGNSIFYNQCSYIIVRFSYIDNDPIEMTDYSSIPSIFGLICDAEIRTKSTASGGSKTYEGALSMTPDSYPVGTTYYYIKGVLSADVSGTSLNIHIDTDSHQPNVYEEATERLM